MGTLAPARARVVLAEVSNDRPAEWLHAYAAPTNWRCRWRCARWRTMPLRCRWADHFRFQQDALPLAFLFEGGQIDSNVANATLVSCAAT
jgi:hypothetical protein